MTQTNLKKNFLLLWLRDALIAASASLTSNSILSAFLLNAGLSEQRVSFYFSFITMVNLAASLLFSGAAGRSKSVIRSCSVFCVCSAVSAAFLAVFCIKNLSVTPIWIGVLLVGALLSAATAIRVVFEYQIPCEVIDKEKFPIYQSVSGVVGSVFGIAAGLAVSRLYLVMEFLPLTAGIFVTAGICLMGAAWANGSLTVIHPSKPKTGENAVNLLKTAREVVSDRDFKKMLLPNFIRGIGMGVMAILPVLASASLDMNASELSLITVCTYISTLLGCVVYGFLSKKWGAPMAAFLGSVLFCLLIPAFGGGSMRFYVLYSVSYIGYNIVCYCIPEIIFRSTKTEKVSAIQTWRMLVTTLGTTLSSALMGQLMGKIPTWTILLIGAAATLFCSGAYFVYYRRKTEIRT